MNPSKMEPAEREYLMLVAEALTECQFLERELKSCIESAIDLARLKGGTTPLVMKIPVRDWDRTQKALPKAALGPLTIFFKKMTADTRLVKALETFARERNFLAHGALTRHIDPGGDVDYHEVEKLTARVTILKSEAERLTAEVEAESRKWIAHLYFDEIKDESARP